MSSTAQLYEAEMIFCMKMYGKKERQVNDYEPTLQPLWDDHDEEEEEWLHLVHWSNDHNDTSRREKVRRHLFATVMWVIGSLITDY